MTGSAEHELNPTGACVLGLLLLGPPPPAKRDAHDHMTGWQINETARQSLARFWNITRSQIYLELSRLEAAGLVETAGSEGPRARRPYRITNAGREAFLDWIRAWAQDGPREDQLRSPLVLAVFFGAYLDPELLRRLLDEYRLSTQRSLESRTRLLDGLTTGQRESLPAATLHRGIAALKMTLGWLDQTIASLPEQPA